jgi:hypothetical protein
MNLKENMVVDLLLLSLLLDVVEYAIPSTV